MSFTDNVVIEEEINQSDILKAINKSSVNTVRCFTLLIGNDVIVPWAFIKAGREGAIIDNGAAGGIMAAIDTINGIIVSNGFDEYGRNYDIHPDSNFQFKDFQLPEWDNLLSIVKEMSSKISTAKWIGWDMAHTPKGWVVVEGNSVSEVIGPQLTHQKGIREEFFSLVNKS